MYDVPDTSFIKVGNTNVLISVYSPNKKITSKFLAEKLDTLLQAQGKYLGGKLPVDTYVAGPQPLPLQEIFNIVGVNYQPEVETKDSSFSLGRISIGFNPQTKRLKISDTIGMNKMGRTLGYLENDEIISIDRWK
jgi:hypothetical protein